MIQMYVEDVLLDILSDTGLTYTMSVGDIFNLSVISSSYTNSFTLPKTPRNVRAMEQLGISGDTSTVPYRKNEIKLNSNGFPIIQSGWLSVSETTDNGYKIAVIDGVIDFFKLIENRSIGSLDLSELNHVRNMDNVLGSFSGKPYRYILADYNGEVIRTFEGDPHINIDYLVPSASIPYLWDKIFSFAGWTYQGEIFSNPDFSDTWITFAKGLDLIGSEEVLLSADDVTFPTINASQAIINVGAADINEFGNVSYFEIPEDGTYKFDVTGKIYGVAKDILGRAIRAKVNLSLYRNGEVLSVIGSNLAMEDEFEFTDNIILNQGDVITLVADSAQPQISFRIADNQVVIGISKIEQNNIDFTSIFSDFQIKDFVKEIVMRFGLTLITDTRNKVITFIGADNRLSVTGAMDWTDKYKNRTSEKYIFGNYAKVNRIMHKYNVEGDIFNDGYLIIDNDNIEDTKPLFQSKTYSYDNSIRNVWANIQTYLYPMYSAEPKVIQQEGQDVTVIEYKPLSSRFYIMKSRTVATSINFISPTFDETGSRTSAPFANDDMTTFAELVPKYWAAYARVLTDFRCHNIELVMSDAEVSRIDLDKLVYFAQEANYYMINQIKYSPNGQTTGEFIRVKI